MDDTDWAATGLFSPSKARLAQAQAKEWSLVESWLARKYATGRPPTFERNEDTLQALLTLVSLNDAADERRAVVERIERAALQHCDKQKSEFADALFRSISESLDQAGHDGVETLAQSSLLLHTSAKQGIIELAMATSALQMQAFETQQAETSAVEQLNALKLEHAELQRHLPHLRGDSFKVPTSLVEETAQWQKGVKHLRAKIGEYDERITTVRPAQSMLIMLDETKQLLTDVTQQRSQLVVMDDEIAALQSFPRQQSAARAMIEEATARLHTLRQSKANVS